MAMQNVGGVNHILTADEITLERYDNFKKLDPAVQKLIMEVFTIRSVNQGLPVYVNINGVDVPDLDIQTYTLAVDINRDPSTQEIVKLLIQDPLYEGLERTYAHLLPYNRMINMSEGKQLLYLAIITVIYKDSPKFNKKYRNEAAVLMASSRNVPDNAQDLYRLAKIALYLHMYPELADESVLSMDVKIGVIQLLEQPNPPPNIVVIKNYLKRNDISAVGWIHFIDWEDVQKHPDTVISALYNFVITQLQPGGGEARVTTDEFDRRTGTLSVACDAKQYPELEAAALSLLQNASLMSLCQAVTMFQERLELTGPCSEAEVGDIIDVLTQLIPTLSKRELCALIGIFR